MEDAIVCGGSHAGLAAALWLGRYRRKTLVLDGGSARNRAARASHGYLGSDGRPPQEILDRARADLSRYDTVTIEDATADSAAATAEGFVITAGSRRFHSKRLLLATGVEDACPDIPGLDELYGRHLFHCSCCDGYESSGQSVLAIGWGEHVAGFALDLLDWGARVTLVTNGEEFEGDRSCETALRRHHVEVIEERVARFILDGDSMTGVALESGREIPATRAFFSIKHRPRSDLARQLGCTIDELGYITVGDHGETSIEHVYAAGDVTPGEQLVQTAAAEGAVAGIACALSLRGESTPSPAPDPGPDPQEEIG